MTEPHLLVTSREAARRTTVHLLREQLALAEAGEVVSVTIVAELSNGNYKTWHSDTLSRLQSAGALLEAAIGRLG